MDEITLYEELQPPAPPDALRMRQAARARLTQAMSAPPAHPHPRASRRRTVVAAAGAAALMAAGTGYGLTAVHRGASSPRAAASTRGGGERSQPAATAAGLTAVRGCPGMYMTAGTLEKVSGAQLVVQPVADHAQVTVDTTASTAVTRPATGTVAGITDGSSVSVRGTWSGDTLAATQVVVEAALPAQPAPRFSSASHVRTLMPPMGLPRLFTNGTVVDAHDGGFTVLVRNPIAAPGVPARVQVITSSSTQVAGRVSATLSQLDLDSNVLAVGPIGANGVMTAGIVAESSRVLARVTAGGPVKLQPSGCSASAITTAAIQAGA